MKTGNPRAGLSTSLGLIIVCILLFGVVAGCTTLTEESPEGMPIPETEETAVSGEASEEVPGEVPGEASEEDTPGVDWEQRFIEAVRSGDIDLALTLYESSGAGDPLLLGSLLMASGRVARAENMFTQVTAQEEGADRVEALFNLGMIALTRNDLPRAEEFFMDTVEQEPAHSQALSGLGVIALDRGNTAIAMDLFTRSLESDPENVQALLGRAQLWMEREQFTRAAGDYSAALAIMPEAGEVYGLRARARALDGGFSGALEDYNRAVSLAPENPWNLLDRGRLLLRAGRFEESLEDFTALLEMNDGFDLALVYRAQAFDSMGNTEAALEDYRRILELQPDYTEVYAPAGVAYFKTNQFDEAGRLFVRAAEQPNGRKELLLLAALSGYYQAYQGEQRDARGVQQTNRRLEEWAARFDREGLFYAIVRYFLSPGYDGAVIQAVQGHTKPLERAQGQVYLGAFFLLEGKTATALALLSEIGETVLAGLPEGRLAQWLVHEYTNE
ncbi:tetratricopeptide repeat protein [Spirochaeta lutea]|uniref:Uncharacterized protein n=1 Tax=Spirochaeta lutea TaxID=1480694 RepID=A0A098QUP0_9SPIO|nr:tetratricopeptide repeat protein [Spirochaeta lutea]KGE71575.1 hypothetical protein DC28_09810 [Spirochaeta lutea]